MRNDEKIATKQEERCNNKQPRLSTGSETSIKTKHHQKWGTEKAYRRKTTRQTHPRESESRQEMDPNASSYEGTSRCHHRNYHQGHAPHAWRVLRTGYNV